MKIGLMLLLLSFQAFSLVETSHESLRDLLKEVRDGEFTSEKRKETLKQAQDKMKALLSQELKTGPRELNHFFIKYPDKVETLKKSPWAQVLTEFYTTLHQT